MLKLGRFTHILLSACLVVLFSIPCWGQITNVADDQLAPIPGAGHDYIHMLTETVNPANGSMNLEIHLPVPRGRGFTLPFAFAYNSNGVHHPGGSNGHPSWLTDAGYLSSGGWSYVVPMVSTQEDSIRVQNYLCYFYSNYMMQTSAGEGHALGLSVGENGTGSCPPGGLIQPYLSGADDYYQATTTNMLPGHGPYTPPVTVADADGTVYQFSTASAHGPYNNVVDSLAKEQPQINLNNLHDSCTLGACPRPESFKIGC